MRAKQICLLIAALAIAFVVLFKLSRHEPTIESVVQVDAPVPPSAVAAPMNGQKETGPGGLNLSKVRRRAAEFSDDERAHFNSIFEQKLKPAVVKWCQAYDGHIPFSPDDVSADKFVERFSKDSSYAEYIFVVNGTTLGVRNVRGAAQVDYLNDPRQTKLMATIPNRTEPPITSFPVLRDEIMKMLEAESGCRFPAHEIRMKQSGFSGSLDGGVLVHVGGEPENGASWKYDLVFGPDGKLAFYLMGMN